MSIESSVKGIVNLLDKLRRYNTLIIEDGLEPATVADMKNKAKDFCNSAKV